MTDPRIQHFEDNMKRDPIGHGCHVIRMGENSFRVHGTGDDAIYREHQDGEYSGNVVFNVDRSEKRHVVIPVKGGFAETETLPTGPGYVATAWSGYTIRIIYIEFPIAGFYDNDHQWTVAAVGDVIREPVWPVVQNHGVIFGDGRNNAPSYDPALDIRRAGMGSYAVPITEADILLELSLVGDFVQLEAFTSAESIYTGAATTNITSGGGEPAKWYYLMRTATGTLYESA